MSRRDGKNIDSTDNEKRGSTIKSKKVRKGATFLSPNLPCEWGQKNFNFYLRGVKNSYLALRGVS